MAIDYVRLINVLGELIRWVMHSTFIKYGIIH